MGEPEVGHEASSPVVNELLDLFSVPPTDTTFKKGGFTVHNLIQVGVNPVEFIVHSRTEYTDLAQSYFTIEAKLSKGDGTPIVAATQLYPTPNLFCNMIEQPSVWLNGTLVTEQADTYAYKAYLETWLNYGDNASKPILYPRGWYKASGCPSGVCCGWLSKQARRQESCKTELVRESLLCCVNHHTKQEQGRSRHDKVRLNKI